MGCSGVAEARDLPRPQKQRRLFCQPPGCRIPC